MTGFRIGYGAGPSRADRRHEHHAVAVEFVRLLAGQAAAVAALNGDQGFVAEARGAYRARRDRTVELLNAIPGMSCRSPDGAFYVYPSCSGLIGKRTPEGKLLDNGLRRCDVLPR